MPMDKKERKPGDMLKMLKSGHKSKAMKMAGIKMTGKFEGKSNKLGHGGRAAQLKARGVPGGVIGELARKAHAAPGQANYHGGHKRKGAEKMSGSHIHIHIHGGMSPDVEHNSDDNQVTKEKHSEKKRKFSHGEGKVHASKASEHKCKGSACKHASHKRKFSQNLETTGGEKKSEHKKKKARKSDKDGADSEERMGEYKTNQKKSPRHE